MGVQVSHFELHNNTDKDIINTEISNVDGFDWSNNNRPDRNLKGLRIKANGGSIRQREDTFKPAKYCPFTMKLTFSDGSIDEFKIHQKYAIGCCSSFVHITRSHDIYYRCANDTLIMDVKNTTQQLQEQEAKNKNQQGEQKMKQKQYEAAMKLFDEALKVANQTLTINSIKKNKSEACTQIGKAALQEGLTLESDTSADKSKEAQTKFGIAKKMFQQALNLCKSAEHENNQNLITLKLAGNDLFNSANDLEKQAFEMFEDGKKSEAGDKYKAAAVKYEQAAKKFEQAAKIGGAKYEECAQFCRENGEKAKKVVSDIDAIVLSDNMKKAEFDEDEDEGNKNDATANLNLHELVDIVAN